jgi:hypothetical protein
MCQATVIDSDVVIMAGELTHDVLADKSSSADNENSHNDQDSSEAMLSGDSN